jgi:hypothetical protein
MIQRQTPLLPAAPWPPSSVPLTHPRRCPYRILTIALEGGCDFLQMRTLRHRDRPGAMSQMVPESLVRTSSDLVGTEATHGHRQASLLCSGPSSLFFLFFCFFCFLIPDLCWDLNSELKLARQVCYHLSHAPGLFALVIFFFSDRSLVFTRAGLRP